MAAAQEPEDGLARGEVALERRRVVPRRVAERLERLAELLREERRNRVVALVGAREDMAERRPVVRGVRPVLDPAVASEDRVVELRDVADGVDARPRGGEALVDDNAAAHLEA